MRRKVYSFNSELHNVTGVQKVVLSIHNALKGEYQAKVIGFKSYNEVNPSLGIKEDEYVKLRNPLMLRHSVVFVHERKFLALFWLINHLLFLKITVVYVHHSMLYGHRILTILPRHIVAISDPGIHNLTEYFHAPIGHIHKIYNCVEDRKELRRTVRQRDGFIRILYPARINSLKRQLTIVEKLRGKIDARIQIDFAGIGPLYEELKNCLRRDDNQFHSIGFVDDIPARMLEYDYVMLFSKHEGLPISLIEATMTGTPIICNDVGGNVEIGHVGENAFVADDWDTLIETLNSLPELPAKEYEKMCRASRDIYEKHFTYSIFKKNYLDLVKSISL